MDLQNQYSDRQIGILEELGRDYRPKLPKEKLRYIITFWAAHAVLVGAAVGICFVNIMFIIFGILIGVMTILEITRSYIKRLEIYNKLIETGTDLEIGIYASTKSNKVKGNAERKKYFFIRQFRMYGIVALIIGAFFMYSAISNQNFQYSKATVTTETYTGQLQEIVTDKNTVAVKVVNDSDTYYFPYTKYASAFNWDKYNSDIKDNATSYNVTMIASKDAVSTNMKYCYSIKINLIGNEGEGEEYLPLENIWAIQKQERIISYSIGGSVLFIGAACLASLPIYIYAIYKKNLEKETLDLTSSEQDTYEINVKQGKVVQQEYLDGEVVEGGQNVSNNSVNTQPVPQEKEDLSLPIRVGLPPLYTNVPLYSAMAGILCLLIGNMINVNAAKITLMIVGGSIAVIAVIITFIMKSFYSQVDDKNILVSRLNKKKMIEVSSIKEIVEANGYQIYKDELGNQVLALSNKSQFVKEFNDRLVKLGVGQTEIISTDSNGEYNGFSDSFTTGEVTEVEVKEVEKEESTVQENIDNSNDGE